MQVETELTNVTEIFDEMSVAQRNGEKVIAFASVIEKLLADIISGYLFKTPTAEKQFFDEMILFSDTFAFSAKIRVVLQIAGSQWEKRELQAFKELLYKAMSYRNAFTHGALRGTKTGVFLKFFQGGPREQMLNDEYLTVVETGLWDCASKVEELMVKLGITAAVPISEMRKTLPTGETPAEKLVSEFEKRRE
jgi:hypothetical protein